MALQRELMPAHGSPSLIVAHIDGASRGNPGPAAYGVVLENEDGSHVASLSKTCGHTTNNVAEYQALLAALEHALDYRVQRLKVLSDSELLVRQIRGFYKVRSPELRPLYERARQAIARLESFAIQHVPREQNREADRLANKALDAAAKSARHHDTETQGKKAAGGPIRVKANFEDGMLRPQEELPLLEGEEVELEVRRKGIGSWE